MLIMSKVFDKRINSWNFYVESTFGEYLKFAKKKSKNFENDLFSVKERFTKRVYYAAFSFSTCKNRYN